MTSPLLLASTSPRRRTLVAELGLAVRVLDPGVDDAREAGLLAEILRSGASPAEGVRRLAVVKLLAALPRARAGEQVLAADTTVALGALPLGKPADLADARAMLQRLRGRPHAVHSGVALLDARGRLRTGVATSEVRFRPFSAQVLETFLASGLWAGKAGGYGVQDPEAGPLVERVSGSRSNVKGLPLELVTRLLELA